MDGWILRRGWAGAGVVMVEGERRKKNAKAMLCLDFQAQLANAKCCKRWDAMVESFECPLGCWREHT